MTIWEYTTNHISLHLASRLHLRVVCSQTHPLIVTKYNSTLHMGSTCLKMNNHKLFMKICEFINLAKNKQTNKCMNYAQQINDVPFSRVLHNSCLMTVLISVMSAGSRKSSSCRLSFRWREQTGRSCSAAHHDRNPEPTRSVFTSFLRLLHTTPTAPVLRDVGPSASLCVSVCLCPSRGEHGCHQGSGAVVQDAVWWLPTCGHHQHDDLLQERAGFLCAHPQVQTGPHVS